MRIKADIVGSRLWRRDRRAEGRRSLSQTRSTWEAAPWDCSLRVPAGFPNRETFACQGTFTTGMGAVGKGPKDPCLIADAATSTTTVTIRPRIGDCRSLT